MEVITMENITIGQIATWIALIGGIITGASLIVRKLKEWILSVLTEKFNGIDLRLDDLRNDLNEVNKVNLRAFLIQELRAIEHGEILSEMEMSYFKDQYHYYTDVLHENSYIHDKYEKLKEKGLL
jgi:hypothetical protein